MHSPRSTKLRAIQMCRRFSRVRPNEWEQRAFHGAKRCKWNVKNVVNYWFSFHPFHFNFKYRIVLQLRATDSLISGRISCNQTNLQQTKRGSACTPIWHCLSSVFTLSFFALNSTDCLCKTSSRMNKFTLRIFIRENVVKLFMHTFRLSSPHALIFSFIQIPFELLLFGVMWFH